MIRIIANTLLLIWDAVAGEAHVAIAREDFDAREVHIGLLGGVLVDETVVNFSDAAEHVDFVDEKGNII